MNSRTYSYKIYAAAVSLLACASLYAAAPSRLPAELDAYVVSSMQAGDVPGVAVTVVNSDEPPIAQGFGVRRMGAPELVDANTVFNIASLAKSFTAAGAAVLVDEGKIGWNDPVTKWLPGMRFHDAWLTEHITLADLLSHRTGLQPANTMWRHTRIDRAEILRRVRYMKPAEGFRTQQVYNNALYTVAGEVTAAAAGMSWEQLIRTRLLEPLRMSDTTVGVLAEGGNVASPHAVIDGKQQPVRPASYVSIAPAGGINSTATDMARWMQFQLAGGAFGGKQIVSTASMDAMHEPWTMIPTTPAMRAARQVQFFAGYGFGWNVMDYRGYKLLWHSGNADGMPSYMALLPGKRIGVVVMVNTWKAPFLHGDIASRVLDHYLGLPTKDYAAETLALTRTAEAKAEAEKTQAANTGQPTTAPSPPLDLAAYAGTYVDELFGNIIVAKTPRGLSLQMGQGEFADLEHVNRETFAVRWRDRVIGEGNDTRVTFVLDDQDNVVRLAMKVRRDSIEAHRPAG